MSVVNFATTTLESAPTYLPSSVVRRQTVVPPSLDRVDRKLEQRRQVGHRRGVVGADGAGRRQGGASEDVPDAVSPEQPSHVLASRDQLDEVVTEGLVTYIRTSVVGSKEKKIRPLN